MKSVPKRALGLKSLALIAAALLICSLFTFFTYRSIRNLLYRDNANTIYNLTASAVGQLEAEMNKNIGEVRHLAEFTAFYAEHESLEDETFQRFAKDFCDSNGYDTIYMADTAGNVELDGEHYNIADREYFSCGMQGHNFLSSPVINRATGRRVIVFGSPIVIQGQITGLVFVTKRVEDLYEPFGVPFYNIATSLIVAFALYKALHMDSNKTAGSIFEFADNDRNDPDSIQAIRDGMDAGREWAGTLYDGHEDSFFCYVPIDNIRQGVDVDTPEGYEKVKGGDWVE